jgi:glutamyl-tRNA reductase
LHAPTQALKDLATTTDGAGTVEWVKAQKLLSRLFELEDKPLGGDGAPGDPEQENKE